MYLRHLPDCVLQIWPAGHSTKLHGFTPSPWSSSPNEAKELSSERPSVDPRLLKLRLGSENPFCALESCSRSAMHVHATNALAIHISTVTIRKSTRNLEFKMKNPGEDRFWRALFTQSSLSCCVIGVNLHCTNHGHPKSKRLCKMESADTFTSNYRKVNFK